MCTFAAELIPHSLWRTLLVAGAFAAVSIVEIPAAQLTLQWTDNSSNETGFKLERSDNGSTFAQVAALGADVTSYVDTGLADGASYSYRVCAYNEYGSSAFSTVASSTTPLPPPPPNTAPTISAIADLTIENAIDSGEIAFTVGDGETAASDLAVTGSSSNVTLVPNANIVFGGTGSSRTVRLTPVAGQSGSATITIAVSDGSLSTSETFVLTVIITVAESPEPPVITKQPQSQVIGRWSTATLDVAATGSDLSYQWYSGTSGNTSAPIGGATSPTFTTASLKRSADYWVRVSSGKLFADSVTATVTVDKRAQSYSSSVETESGAAFAMSVDSDGIAELIAASVETQALIKATDIVVADDGTFSFEAEGVGQVSGQILDGEVFGLIEATGEVFSGIEEGVDGTTAHLAGSYAGVILNSSDGEISVLAGANGHAFVLLREGGAFAASLVDLRADGSFAFSTNDGRAFELAIDATSDRVSGTVSRLGQVSTVSNVPALSDTQRKLSNTSIRARVGQGSELMVAGFVIAGEGTKDVLVRAVGPTLADYGVAGVLSDPVIHVFRQGDPVGAPAVAGNDDWSESPQASEIAQVSERLGAFALPVGSKDGALLLTLPAGGYTAHITGAQNETGGAIVEIYDADDLSETISATRLANISMRGMAGEGGDAVVAGFVVSGTVPKRLLIRAVGPELAGFGVSPALGDPMLHVFQAGEAGDELISSNSDWSTDAAAVSSAGAAVGAFELTAGSKSAALVIWLAPGVYTAQASSAGGPAGIALIEVFEIE